MKLIVCGGSGFVGKEVITQALSHASVSSVIALSRRPLTEPPFDDAKVKVVVIEDFEKGYTPEVLEQLKGAKGCCWALGAKSSDANITRKVHVDYPIAATTAFSKLARETNTKFRFAYTSGIITVRDQTKSLWVLSDLRKIGGEGEIKLLDFAKANEETLDAFILRPGGIRPKDSKMLPDCIVGGFNVRVNEVAATLLEGAVSGLEKDTFENADIVKKGRELLAKESEK